MSHSVPPRKLTLLTLPPEIQLAIVTAIDTPSWDCLRDSLGFDPSICSGHDILDDKTLASVHLAIPNRKDMIAVNRMSQTSRYFYNILAPYLYSRYCIKALRHCFLRGGLETLHKIFQLRGMPESRALNDLLIAASTLRNDEMCQELLRLGADPSFVQVYEPVDLAVLEAATRNTKYSVSQWLAQEGTNLNLAQNGTTPLLEAVRSDTNYDYVKFLLSQGAMVNLSLADGALPLHEAITNCAEQNARLLLQHGAKPNYRDARTSSRRISANHCPSAMEAAVFRGTEQIFCDLVAFNADILSPNVSGECRYMLERMALSGTGSRVARTMFDAGLPLEITLPSEGETFMHCAASGGSLRWLEMLFYQYDFNVNALTKHHNTPIEWAEDQPQAQDWLLKHGSLPMRRARYIDDEDDDDYMEE